MATLGKTSGRDWGIIIFWLIILLVLAAIIIVWQVVNSTVTRSAGEAEGLVGCLGMSLEVVSTTPNETSLNYTTLKRGNDDLSLESIKVIVENSNGEQECNVDIPTTEPKSFGQKTLEITGCNDLSSGKGYKVKIAPKINGKQCDVVVTQNFNTL